MTDSLALQLITEIVQTGNETALKTLLGGGATGDAATPDQITRLCDDLLTRARCAPYPFRTSTVELMTLSSVAHEMQFIMEVNERKGRNS